MNFDGSVQDESVVESEGIDGMLSLKLMPLD
jgi:hypothetical protein